MGLGDYLGMPRVELGNHNDLRGLGVGIYASVPRVGMGGIADLRFVGVGDCARLSPMGLCARYLVYVLVRIPPSLCA